MVVLLPLPDWHGPSTRRTTCPDNWPRRLPGHHGVGHGHWWEDYSPPTELGYHMRCSRCGARVRLHFDTAHRISDGTYGVIWAPDYDARAVYPCRQRRRA